MSVRGIISRLIAPMNRQKKWRCTLLLPQFRDCRPTGHAESIALLRYVHAVP